jgi:hypothetical protein
MPPPPPPDETPKQREDRLDQRWASLDESLRATAQASLEVWRALQHLLGAGTNISKLLWGSEPQGRGIQREASRAQLRSVLRIPDTAELRKRGVRNGWEHIDERLEDWWAESPTHSIAHRNIGGFFGGFATKEQFLHFDPQTGTVIFWDEVISVSALVDEARTLQARLEAILRRARRGDV